MSTLSELIPSGGTQNNIEFVAQGTLANGQAVALRSDGKVEAVAGVAGSVGSIVAYGSTNQNEIAATYDSTNNKVVLTALNGSNYGTATVGTVSGSSISFGSPVVFNSGNTLFINIGFDSSNSKVVIAYQDQGNGGKGTAIVGTVSGTSISFGSEVVFRTSDATSNAVVFDSNSNKIVITYVGGASTYYGYAIVGTVSGTSISFGSEATWRGADTYSAEKGSATFDTLTNQIIVVASVGNDTGRACVGAVSGTSISFGTAVPIGSGTVYTPSVSYDSNNNKVVIAYKDGNNSNYGTAIVGTVSGTSITLGTAAVFQSFATTYTATTFDSTQKVVVVTFSDGEGSSGKGAALPLIVSGTTVSGGDKTNYTSVASYFMAATFDTTAQKSVFAFKEMSSGYPNSVTYTPPSTTATSFIGITNAAISSGATGEVAVKGGLSTTADLGTFASSAGSATEFAASDVENQIFMTYDTTNNKVIVVYKDLIFKAVVGTVSGTGISFGSPVTLLNSGATSFALTFDVNAGKLVAIYGPSSNGYATAVIGTVSGTSISFGTPVVWASSSSGGFGIDYDAVAQKVLIAYHDGGSDAKAIVGTVSGTSISFGSAAVFVNYQSNDSMVSYDVTANKSLIIYQASNSGYGIVATISGTSVSFGSSTVITTGQGVASSLRIAYDSSLSKHGFLYKDDQGYHSRVATVSGTSVSFGAIAALNPQSGGALTLSITYDTSSGAMLYITSVTAGNSGIFTSVAKISGTDLIFPAGTQLSSGFAYQGIGSVYDPDSAKVVIGREDNSDNYHGYSQVITITGDSLVIGSNYFVQDDGSLATTSSSTKAGKAISATALNLVDPT